MNFYADYKYSLASSIGIGYEIYLSGCKGYCKGCHSDHTHDFNAGVKIDDNFINDFIAKIKKEGSFKFDNFVLLGGEPLDNPTSEVLYFMNKLKDNFSNKKFWLYTHFELNEIDNEIKSFFDFIKTGKFDIDNIDENYKSRGINLISPNQKINEKGIDY